MGIYDDLVPKGGTTKSTNKTTSKSIYSDLIPKKEPVVTPPEKPGLLSRIGSGIKSIAQIPSEFLSETKFFKEAAGGVEIEKEAGKRNIADLTLRKAASLVGGAPPEDLPLGVGEVVKQSKEFVKDTEAKDLTIDDWITGMREGAQGFTSQVVSGGAELPSIATGGAFQPEIRFNIPGIGEVSNSDYRISERVARGEDPNLVVAQEKTGGFLNALFFLGLASRPFLPKPVTLGKQTIPKVSTPKGAVTAPKAQSFKLYTPPKYTTPLTPEYIQKIVTERNIKLGPEYNPELPTFFRMTGTIGGHIKGEIVQIKPSFMNRFITMLKGDVSKVPKDQTTLLLGESTNLTEIKQLPTPKPKVPVVPPPVQPKVPTVIPPEKPIITPPPVEKPEVFTKEDIDYFRKELEKEGIKSPTDEQVNTKIQEVLKETFEPKGQPEVKDIPKKLTIKPEVPLPKETPKDAVGRLPQPVAEVKGQKIKTPKQLVSKTQIKDILKVSGKDSVDFKVIEQDGDKFMSYKDAKNDIKLKPSALGLVEENIKVGSVININKQDLKPTGTSLRLKDEKGTTLASESEGYVPEFQKKKGTLPEQQVNPIEIPEMVDFARDLMGKVPDIVKKTGKASGRFTYGPKGESIKIVAKLFKEGNLRDASVTLAHEIGHLIDWVPTGTTKKGNLINRLKDIRGLLKKTFGATETVTNKTVRDELLKVTQKLHPYDPKKSLPSYVRYRRSAVELYAEAVSMLFNSPGLLQEMAPNFYEQFFNALDANPKVRDAYFELQALLSGERADLIAHRRAGVQQMFKEGDYKAQELQNERIAKGKLKAREYMQHLKFGLIDINAPIINRISALQKKGIHINPDDNPVYYLEERNYLGGRIKALLERNIQPIYSALGNVGIPWRTFGETLFYQRIMAGDRSTVANPRGITPDAAAELYDNVVKEMTPEQRKVLRESTDAYRKFVKRIAQEAHNEGLTTPEMNKTIQENPAYAAFQVLEHLDEGMSAKIHKQIGTFKDIANPADSTILKMIATVRAIERNKVNRVTVDGLLKNSPDEIQEAKTISTGKGKRILDTKNDQKTVIVMRGGKPQGYYVDPYIAKSLKNESIGQNKVIVSILRPLRLLNQYVFRPVFIGYNPGFMAFNAARDFLRFWKNIPDMTIGTALKRYVQGARLSKIRGFGISKNPSPKELEAQKILLDLEEQQVFSVTFTDLMTGGSVDEIKQIDSILKKSGIGEFQKQKPHILLRPIMPILHFLENLGQTVETMSKAAGYYEIAKDGKPLTIEQRSYLRKYVGSPDFLAGGYLKAGTNEALLFSNAIAQGIRSDIQVAVEPKTRSGYWWKTAKLNILPKILMFMASLGLFGEKTKDMMDDASEYDKTNYTILPLGQEKGKTVYIRIPQDEFGRIIGGFFWKIINRFNPDNKTNITEDAAEIMSFMGGQVPGFSPSLTTPAAILTYLQGNNPYNAFRGRLVIPDQEFEAGGSRANKEMLRYTFEQLGGGIFYKFDSGPPREKTPTEKTLSLPVISNTLGRFIQISNYGETESLREVQGEVKKQEARQRLSDRDAVNKGVTEAINAGAKTKDEIKSFQEQVLIDVFGTTDIKGKEDIDHANKLMKNFKLTLVRGTSDPAVGVLISATSNAQKIAIMKELRANMTLEDYTEFAKAALNEKVISVEVVNKASKQE